MSQSLYMLSHFSKILSGLFLIILSLYVIFLITLNNFMKILHYAYWIGLKMLENC